jgi:hypothetical protein
MFCSFAQIGRTKTACKNRKRQTYISLNGRIGTTDSWISHRLAGDPPMVRLWIGVAQFKRQIRPGYSRTYEPNGEMHSSAKEELKPHC